MSSFEKIARYTTWRALLSIFFVAFGIFFFVFGGYDDSPGAQGLGLLIALYGAVRLWRMRNRAS